MARGIVDAVERRFEGANRIFGKSQSDLRVRPVREFVDRVERLVDARSPIAGFGIADTAVSFDRLVEDARESLFENGVVGPEARRGEIEATHQRLVALRRFRLNLDYRSATSENRCATAPVGLDDEARRRHHDRHSPCS